MENNRMYFSFSQLDTALIDAYEYMQKYAVGLEQIVWDQEDLQLEFRKQFKETEYKLRTVSSFFSLSLSQYSNTFWRIIFIFYFLFRVYPLFLW